MQRVPPHSTAQQCLCHRCPGWVSSVCVPMLGVFRSPSPCAFVLGVPRFLTSCALQRGVRSGSFQIRQPERSMCLWAAATQAAPRRADKPAAAVGVEEDDVEGFENELDAMVVEGDGDDATPEERPSSPRRLRCVLHMHTATALYSSSRPCAGCTRRGEITVQRGCLLPEISTTALNKLSRTMFIC